MTVPWNVRGEHMSELRPVCDVQGCVPQCVPKATIHPLSHLGPQVSVGSCAQNHLAIVISSLRRFQRYAIPDVVRCL